MLIRKPPMGWNTWNTFGSNIEESLIRESADAFVEYGLRDAGYQYLVIDDCWSKKQRDPVTDRIVADPVKFPSGMKVVADYVHSRGLKFGMYSCAGQRTCADFPGSFDHEYLDAKTFAEWGVDYLKYDYCFVPEFVDGPKLYHRMGMALRASGRDIVFSACCGIDGVHDWIRSSGAHLYRSMPDIRDNAASYRKIALTQLSMLSASAPECFNDLDMLTVGMYGKGLAGSTGCNDADYRSQFSLWCFYSAPLMLGCDIRNMNETTRKLVTNPDLIAIDQDEEARPPMGSFSPWSDHLLVLMKHLANGKYALGFFNMEESDAEIPATFANFGLTANSGFDLKVRGVFSDEEDGTYREYMRVKVPAHDCRVYFAELVAR